MNKLEDKTEKWLKDNCEPIEINIKAIDKKVDGYYMICKKQLNSFLNEITKEKNKEIDELRKDHAELAKEASKALLNANNQIEYLKHKINSQNPFYLKDSEYKKMKKMGSNVVKLDNSNGIGVGVLCLNKNGEWINITDYSSW